jgi:hypothetical protein
MKTLIALLCLSAQSLTAALIDTTPGGFDWSTATQIPPSLATIFHKEGQGQLAFFDDAAVVQPDGGHSTNIPGWVSAFGVLNGGTLFDTDLMDLDPTPTANVWWDFGDTGFSLRWIDAFGRDANGTPWEHWYYVNGISFANAGSAQVTLNGSARIQDIALYGRTPFMPVPESGQPWVLMALGIVATLLYKRLQNNSQTVGK